MHRNNQKECNLSALMNLFEKYGGVPTVNLVVPTRYTHVHTGIINRRDFDQMVDLMVAILQRLDANTVKELRNFAP